MDQIVILYWVAVAGSIISYLCLCATDLVKPTLGQALGFMVVTFIPVMNALFTLHCLSTLFQGIFMKKTNVKQI